MKAFKGLTYPSTRVCNLPVACIGVEEHATFPALGDESPFYDEIWKTKSVREDLLDKEHKRKADMRLGHMAFQIMSQLPGIANARPPEHSRAANDQLAEVIRADPSAFGGFAALPMSRPEEAARELERAVKELGLFGAMIDSHLPDMTHYDDRKYWPVFRMAQLLDVPIYIHPSPASEKVMNDTFNGDYPQVVATGLSTGAWGWHADVGLHIVKLFAAGVFKEFPKLKIIAGHMGEMIPMMIDRIDRLKFFQRGGLGSFRQVWETNIWVTTSGIFSVRTLEMLLKVTALDRIMFSVDTPFEKGETGWAFIQAIAESGVLNTQELEKLAFGNAQSFFNLPDDILTSQT